jgi:hypothetical protein
MVTNATASHRPACPDPSNHPSHCSLGHPLTRTNPTSDFLFNAFELTTSSCELYFDWTTCHLPLLKKEDISLGGVLGMRLC